ncbi:MAG: DUF2779 domain-containing protein [Patescibacteria group bacterium]
MKLTKTDFLAYLDAPRHLWATKNEKLEKKELDAYLEHLFKQGYNVEKFAERYIQEYLVHQYQASSKDLLIQPTHIDRDFEARTDVLIKNPETNLWDMYEIKSTTSVSKQHKYDATFQALIFKKKYKLGNIFILHLNDDYVRKGEINPNSIFLATDITDQVEKLKDEVHMLRYEALDVLNEEDYNRTLSCIRPKTCPCLDLCHKDLPDYSIYDINNLTANEKKIRQLEEMEVFDIRDVPKDFSLSDKQSLQVQVAKSAKASIDEEGIKADLEGLEYPLYFIDYESFNPAIPMYDGYKPFDQIPFQWSLHVQDAPDSKLRHYEFIEIEQIDPIPNFLNSLKKVLGATGSIIVWNQTFEGTLNKRMAEICPELEDFCKDMNERMYDLMDLFRDGIYADPKCKGSYSIKKVLPVLVPGLSYDGMDIAEGATAMAKWYEMVYKIDKDEKDQKEKIRKDLLKYCELDTLAMVRIFERLWEIIND